MKKISIIITIGTVALLFITTGFVFFLMVDQFGPPERMSYTIVVDSDDDNNYPIYCHIPFPSLAENIEVGQGKSGDVIPNYDFDDYITYLNGNFQYINITFNNNLPIIIYFTIDGNDQSIFENTFKDGVPIIISSNNSSNGFRILYYEYEYDSRYCTVYTVDYTYDESHTSGFITVSDYFSRISSINLNDGTTVLLLSKDTIQVYK